jgi:hypothetical protein
VKVIERAVMGANITSMTADQTAKALQTTMITFKLGVKDASGVLDQWNEINCVSLYSNI